MSSRRTFVAACLSGSALLSDIDDYIDEWHDSDDVSLPEIHAYLGMSHDEYKLWVERPESLRFILAAHKNQVPLDNLFLEQSNLMAAARSEERGEAVLVLQWLIKTGRVNVRDS